MLRLPALAAAIALSTAGANAATPEREKQLLDIAASCAAFYQAGFDRLDLTVEPNEARRQAFIDVVDALSARQLPAGAREAWFMEHVVGRTAIVVNIIDLKPDEAIPKVRQNLGACDKLLPEMNAAAGLE
ncbi:MAG: hypothetical protein RLO51_16710 [Thalassobaculum sp.]|uniref:hypothetical protein n=1 Tax=Thalassobaculum sp. TaxID=2022740 RepID=UPI0032EE80AB